MITARLARPLSAEIGIMRHHQQIDALDSDGAQPDQISVVPILLAALLTFPLLAGCFSEWESHGGFLVGVKLLGVSSVPIFRR